MADQLRPPPRAAALREPLAVVEPALLALNSWKLVRQPRGTGRPVLVFPGFGAGDISTIPLRRYLRGLGHDARGWGLGQNQGDMGALVPVVRDRVIRLADEQQHPVPLVGWSLGGVIAREVAREAPESVEQVITFGSPVVGGPKYTRVGDTYRARGVDLDEVEAQIASRDAVPITVPITAIYTKGDGVVAWRACIDHVSPRVEHVEVKTTHIGLGLHHEVFAEVARRLGHPPEPVSRP
jgi:pimeloyl-ACP methyl ester carboxylesterase